MDLSIEICIPIVRPVFLSLHPPTLFQPLLFCLFDFFEFRIDMCGICGRIFKLVCENLLITIGGGEIGGWVRRGWWKFREGLKEVLVHLNVAETAGERSILRWGEGRGDCEFIQGGMRGGRR